MPTAHPSGREHGRPVATPRAGQGTPIYLSASPFGAGRLAEAVRIARATGCAGLDVNVGILNAAESAATLAGMPVAVVGVSWQSQRPADLAPCMALAGRLGAGVVNVYPTLSPGEDPALAREALVSTIETTLKMSNEDGPMVTLENALERPPGLASTFDAWLGILKAVDSPRVRGALDAANFIASGDAACLPRIVPEAGPWIGYVHAKGVVPFSPDLHEREPFRRVWEGAGRWLAAPAGEGAPDYRELLTALLRAGYGRAVGVEPFDCEPPIRRAVAFLRSVLSASASSGDR